MVLLGVCIWYAFASPMRGAVLAASDPTLHGWYVHQPTGYNFCILLFSFLDIPAVIAAWVMMSVLDALVSLMPQVRATVAFATVGIGSAAWWRVVARLVWKVRSDAL
jgi:hypothetical protein